MLETALRYSDVRRRQVDMPSHLGSLTAQALLRETSNLTSDTGPAKFTGNQLDRGLNAWMGDSVEGGENGVAERRRDKRAKRSRRDIAEETAALHWSGGNEQRCTVT